MLTLALQTDSRGVSAVVADRSKSGAAKLVGVATIPLADSAENLAKALREALPKLRGGKPHVAVALGPDESRVRKLSVPPAPPEELPPLVAMQAAREAGADADDLVADFLPPEGAAEGPQALLSVWANEERIAFWREVAEHLGGKLTVATPRALAALPATDDAPEVRLFASRAGDSVDFAAVRSGRPLLLRSAHVGDGDATRELRRTQLALSGEGIESPTVLPLNADLLDESYDTLFPAWPELNSADLIDASAYDQSLAATGLALNDATPVLNLADPRRPPVAETGRRRQVLLIAATVAVLAAGAWMARERLVKIDRQIKAKQSEINVAREDVEAFEPFRERVAALDAWRASDVTWLDEIERLGRKIRPVKLDGEDFPVDSDIRATQVIATAYVGGDQPGGRIDLTAVARSSSTSGLESRLRDADHPVEPISTTESPAKDAYRYRYTALLRTPADTGEEPGEDAP